MPFQLIFISVDWYRKGGDIVLEIINSLKNLNCKIHLTIVGCKPPSCFDTSHVSVIEHLDKNTEQGTLLLESLLLNSHLMLLPTRADCTPIVIAEAFAYGVPVLANKTGGVGSMITHNINGYLFEKLEAQCYVNKILEIYEEPVTYNRLALASLDASRAIYNWNTWAHTGITAINKVL
jgi:glycosyltransferase involved in cell wall biosynthesis